MNKRIIETTDGTYLYPASHWAELEQFLIGEKRDPKGCFRLSDDTWEAYQYSANRLPVEAGKYRFHFAGLHSCLKFYVKSYCYRCLLDRSTPLSPALVTLPSYLYYADQYILENRFQSLDEIAAPETFQKLWDAQLVTRRDDNGTLLSSSAWRQRTTRTFWLDLSLRFGSPLIIPLAKSSRKRHPTEAAANETKLIPDTVTRQLSNILALHRHGEKLLNRFHHLRLCVLMLLICVGRRINELLAAPRGSGPDGPLSRLPAVDSTPKGALWFNFRPNKGGPQDLVYISPQWEEMTQYCVHELIRYGDEVREFAAPEERHLLILISTWNKTSGRFAVQAAVQNETVGNNDRVPSGRTQRRSSYKHKKISKGFSYLALCHWLNSKSSDLGKYHPGILQIWGITVDGSSNGEIYKLQTMQARHTRQNALAQDPNIPWLIRQRDLNHTNPDVQLAYQHNLRQEHEVLKRKLRGGELMGNGVQWLTSIVRIEGEPGMSLTGYEPGCPAHLDERWRKLIENNPLFFQFNQVPCGYCTLAQGPAACGEFMHCTEAADGGCQYFVTDPGNEQMVDELKERAHLHRQCQQKSLAAGRLVQAGKSATLACRTEALHEQVVQMQERIQRKLRQIEDCGGIDQ